ncbi:MAG: hypothetical protein IPI67_21795 [Myxococcales bacterium]|nr:hypothetical protein [Myxococcales bacterium]
MLSGAICVAAGCLFACGSSDSSGAAGAGGAGGAGNVGNAGGAGNTGGGESGGTGGAAGGSSSTTQASVTFDPQTPADVSTISGARVQLDANSLETASGAAVVGNVTATVTHAVTADSGPEDMPGSFAAIDASGGAVQLISYGVIDVVLKDASDNPVNLVKGKTAQITIPALAAGPQTLPLWYLPAGKKEWVEEGTATRVGNTYVGKVSHFTPWNCDQPIPPSCASGCADSFLDDKTMSQVVALTVVKTSCSVWQPGLLAGTVIGSSEFTLNTLLAGTTYRLKAIGTVQRGIVEVPTDGTCGTAAWHGDFYLRGSFTINGAKPTPALCQQIFQVDLHWNTTQAASAKYPNYTGSSSGGVNCEAGTMEVSPTYGAVEISWSVGGGPKQHAQTLQINEPTLVHQLPPVDLVY